MTAYVYLGITVLIMGIFFILTNIDGGNPHFISSLSYIQFIFLILVPMLTMRLFSEETRQRTDQLLFTSPLKVSDVVLGKYFAATAIYALSLLLIMAFPYILSFHTTVYVRPLFSIMLGTLLLGASFIAVGIFLSSLTDNQIISAVLTSMAILAFILMTVLSQSMPVGRMFSGVFVGVIILAIGFYIWNSSKNLLAGVVFCGIAGAVAVAMRFINPNLYDGLIYRVLTWINLLDRFNAFAGSAVRLADVVYYVTFIGVFIFLTVHVIERRRWK